MADIAWGIWATQTYSPEELECASRGGRWDRASSTCTIAQTLPPAPPLRPDSVSGYVDPQQMHDDGFIYWDGQWVKGNATMTAPVGWTSSSTSSGSRPPGLSSVASVIPSGSVLGYDIPHAVPVALPSFVGGLLGTVRLGGGMRPASGGTPTRVVMGSVSVFPQVRMGVSRWGR